jgi:hypothetical protein
MVLSIPELDRKLPGHSATSAIRTGFINAFQPGRHVPQGLKPACLLAVGGTAEAVPLQNKVTIRVFPLKRVGENSVVPPGLESFFPLFPALKCVRENYSFAPLGLHNLPLFTHGLRRGLHSYAASRLKIWSVTPPRRRNSSSHAHTEALGVRTTLSPRWGCMIYHFSPTAYAVGCILTPLRG